MAISIHIGYFVPLQFESSYLCHYSKNECKNSTDNVEMVGEIGKRDGAIRLLQKKL